MAVSKIGKPFKIVSKQIYVGQLTWTQSNAGKYYVSSANAVEVADDVNEILSIEYIDWADVSRDLFVQPYVSGKKVAFSSNAIPPNSCYFTVRVTYI